MDKLVANLMVLRTVIELKNFSLAAEYLDISQSSVSRKIEELEQELGVELIRRNTRELEIKAIAFAICRQFIIDARHVLGVINKLQLSANHLSGKITAVFPQTFANIYITPYLAEFNRRYPYIQLNIHYLMMSLPMLCRSTLKLRSLIKKLITLFLLQSIYAIVREVYIVHNIIAINTECHILSLIYHSTWLLE